MWTIISYPSSGKQILSQRVSNFSCRDHYEVRMFIFFDQKVKEFPCSETGTRHGLRISSKAYIRDPLSSHDVMMQTPDERVGLKRMKSGRHTHHAQRRA